MILVMRTYNFINKLIRDFFSRYLQFTDSLINGITNGGPEAITFLLGTYNL